MYEIISSVTFNQSLSKPKNYYFTFHYFEAKTSNEKYKISFKSKLAK